MAEPVTTGVEVPTFEGFFHQHHEPLLRVLYLATGDRHESEDLAQEAFERLPRIRPRRPESARSCAERYARCPTDRERR